MNKKDMVKEVSDFLKDSDIKKSVSAPRHVFHVRCDDGYQKDFYVTGADREVVFTLGDIENIIDGFIAVVKDALLKGDSVVIRNFGTFKLNKRAPHRAMHPQTGEIVVIPAHYVPKFEYSPELKKVAKMYELSMSDRENLPEPSFDDFDTDGDE